MRHRKANAPIGAPAISSPARATGSALPLCVDLDGALVLSKPLLESLMRLIKRNPLYVLLAPLWWLRGRGVLSRELGARVTLNPEALAYDRNVIEWLETERSAGRRLWLCTTSSEGLAGRVATHLGIFEGVLTTQLVERFGERGFDYCGNERRDIEIWKRARGAIVVRGSRRLERAAALHTPVLHAFPPRTHALRAVVRALRPHQWAKNVLIIMPLLAAHRVGETSVLLSGLLAVAAFCLCASSVYVLNDLLDLESDRAHARKSKRPFAAGDLSVLTGLILAPSLLAAAFLIAVFLPVSFQLALVTYYALTVAYSFLLKRIVLVDTVSLAALYTLRIIAGGMATGVALSPWMLLFSVFLFLSLAFVKRFAELEALRRQQRLRAAGRDYDIHDLPVLQSLGSASGYLSVLVLALYINSPEVNALYRRPTAIWTLCVLLLYWISRVWMKAQRGEMHDDPVVFALKDRLSLVVGLLAAAAIAVAS
jgi:4-hydroxybenzoate polyprenyltransferase